MSYPVLTREIARQMNEKKKNNNPVPFFRLPMSVLFIHSWSVHGKVDTALRLAIWWILGRLRSRGLGYH